MYSILPLLAVAAAPAQEVLPRKAPAAVRRVVVADAPTGVPWTSGRSAGLTQPFVYANRCSPSAWYPQCGLETFYDTGRLPSEGSQPIVGGAASYRIEGLEFGYVTSETDPALGGSGPSVELRFWSVGSPCASPDALGAPDKVLVLTGLPGTDTPGSSQTILAEVDLTALAEDFVLLADGDGAYDHDPDADLFVWSIRFLGKVNGRTGPLFAGNPDQCPEGASTAWSSSPGEGTGIGSRNNFWIQSPMSPSPCGLVQGCVTFTGLQNSFYLGLRADPVAAPSHPGYPFCFGVACPCANDDPDFGCANVSGQGAFLMGAGSPSVSADDLILTSFGLQPLSFALLFHGGGAPLPMGFGNARLCVGSGGGALGLYRYGPPRATGPLGAVSIQSIASLSQSFEVGGRIDPGETWYFQIWYRDPGACGQGSNMTNAYGISFLP